MKKKKCLPLQMLKNMNAKYPDAWDIIETTRKERGKKSIIWEGTVPDWPDWCYIPMGYCMSIASTQEKDMVRQVWDGALLSALAPWRMTKEIYSFDKELASDLYEQPLDELPTIVFERLPFPAIYIEAPGLVLDDDLFAGFFVSREYDPRRGDVELRLTFCQNNGTCRPYYIAYDSASTIAESVEKVLAGYGDKEDMMSMIELCSKAMQLVLYLCTSNPEVVTTQKAVEWPISHPKDNYKEIRTWSVGVRYGAAIKRYKQAGKSHPGSHSSKRPHYRRGHFHHYWKGPRNDPNKRTLEFIWVDPVLVNADKIDGQELPAVIHNVE